MAPSMNFEETSLKWKSSHFEKQDFWKYVLIIPFLDMAMGFENSETGVKPPNTGLESSWKGKRIVYINMCMIYIYNIYIYIYTSTYIYVHNLAKK